MSNNMTPEKVFAMFAEKARVLGEAEENGEPIPEGVTNGEFSTYHSCFICSFRLYLHALQPPPNNVPIVRRE